MTKTTNVLLEVNAVVKNLNKDRYAMTLDNELNIKVSQKSKPIAPSPIGVSLIDIRNAQII